MTSQGQGSGDENLLEPFRVRYGRHDLGLHIDIRACLLRANKDEVTNIIVSDSESEEQIKEQMARVKYDHGAEMLLEGGQEGTISTVSDTEKKEEKEKEKLGQVKHDNGGQKRGRSSNTGYVAVTRSSACKQISCEKNSLAMAFA